MQLDVAGAIRSSRVPLLVVNGGSDRQVEAELNLAAARVALVQETPLRRTLLLPDLNHLLQHSVSGSSDDYERIAQTIAPSALDAVVKFLDVALGGDALTRPPNGVANE